MLHEVPRYPWWNKCPGARKLYSKLCTWFSLWLSDTDGSGVGNCPTHVLFLFVPAYKKEWASLLSIFFYHHKPFIIQVMSLITPIPSLFSDSAQWISRHNPTSSDYCNPTTFANVDFSGIDIIDLSVRPQNNYTFIPDPSLATPPLDKPLPGLNFCNVTITYDHPGWNDSIVTSIYLPIDWNGRYVANGGAGLTTGGIGLLSTGIMGQLNEGFAVSTTDGGHSSSLFAPASTWALSSPGVVNLPLLVDFAYVSLHDMVLLSKCAMEEFYKEPAHYSYWFGGSQGGRQGHQMAQKYPQDFDGIMALLPAINWVELVHVISWPSFFMDQLQYYPAPCKMEAITKAAIDACDSLDGVEDGLISRPSLCTFEAASVVNQTIDCEGSPLIISEQAAAVVQAVWDGPRSSNGSFQWYGHLRGANLSDPISPAATSCSFDNSTGIRTCDATPFPLGQEWYSSWVLKNNSASIRNISHQQFDDLLDASRREYESIIETANPDLSQFKANGGKMLTWHGKFSIVTKTNPHAHE